MTKAVDLKTRFHKEILPALQKELGIKNISSVPRFSKITLNVGMGTYIKSHNKDYSNIVENLNKISGQKAVVTKAKKAISNFKLRQNEVVGTMVTVRGTRMYDFLNKLVNIVFPRVRDFRGLSAKSVDKNGNFSIGFKEHVVFPEISPDEISKIHGLQVCITTTAKNREQGLALLKAVGFPIK